MSCYDVERIALTRANEVDDDLVTFRLVYPRMVHAEFLTHRVLSRNSSSSRAIPAKKARSSVLAFCEPYEWGANNPGMQSRKPLSPMRKFFARAAWRFGASAAYLTHWMLEKIGAHKQIVNRVIEPYSVIHTVATATRKHWQMFLELRNHPDADPTIHHLAYLIEQELNKDGDDWRNFHLPFVNTEMLGPNPDKIDDVFDRRISNGEWVDPIWVYAHYQFKATEQLGREVRELLGSTIGLQSDMGDFQMGVLGYAMVSSVARCARVSYIRHGELSENYQRVSQFGLRVFMQSASLQILEA
ncbi:MAG: hypothetical protein D6698_11385, partial [Gammaproteobacteria bacterium]